MANLNEMNAARRRRQNRYFSDSFKKKIVTDYENNLVTVTEISKEYDVSRPAVYKWIYKYSLHLKKQTKQVVELKSDTKKIQALKDKIKALEQLIGQQQIKLDFTEKMLELLEQEYGIDAKKKFGGQHSNGSGQTENNTDTK